MLEVLFYVIVVVYVYGMFKVSELNEELAKLAKAKGQEYTPRSVWNPFNIWYVFGYDRARIRKEAPEVTKLAKTAFKVAVQEAKSLKTDAETNGITVAKRGLADGTKAVETRWQPLQAEWDAKLDNLLGASTPEQP